MVAVSALVDGSAAALVEENEGAGFFGGLPEGHELGLVEGASVDVVVNHGALESEGAHTALKFTNGGGYILHGQRSQPSEPVGPSAGHVADFVVIVATGGLGY